MLGSSDRSGSQRHEQRFSVCLDVLGLLCIIVPLIDNFTLTPDDSIDSIHTR